MNIHGVEFKIVKHANHWRVEYWQAGTFWTDKEFDLYSLIFWKFKNRACTLSHCTLIEIHIFTGKKILVNIFLLSITTS